MEVVARTKGRNGELNASLHAAEARNGAFFITIIGEAHREAAAHLELPDRQSVAFDMQVIDVDLRGSDGQGRGHRAGDARRSFCWRPSTQAFRIDEIVSVFIQHGLEVLVDAIAQNAMPVAILGAAPSRATASC